MSPTPSYLPTQTHLCNISHVLHGHFIKFTPKGYSLYNSLFFFFHSHRADVEDLLMSSKSQSYSRCLGAPPPAACRRGVGGGGGGRGEGSGGGGSNWTRTSHVFDAVSLRSC